MKWIDFIFRKLCLNCFVIKKKKSRYIGVYGLFTIDELKALVNVSLNAEYSEDISFTYKGRYYYEVD